MGKDRESEIGETEIRCGHCGRLLAKGDAVRLAIKCPRCGTLNQIHKSGETAKR
jgi:phage FluMu protein Com